MENAMKKLRSCVDNIDGLIMKLMQKRFKLSVKIQNLKSAAVKYSPAREKEILAKCPSADVRSAYIALLAISRTWPDGMEWFFIKSGDKKTDEANLEAFKNVFGCGLDVEPSGASAALRKKLEKISSAGDPSRVMIAVSAGEKSDVLEGLAHKYADYRKDGKIVFSIYSAASSPDGKPAVINL